MHLEDSLSYVVSALTTCDIILKTSVAYRVSPLYLLDAVVDAPED